jgi:hypothetical protein
MTAFLWCLGIYLVLGAAFGGFSSFIAAFQGEHLTTFQAVKLGLTWPIWVFGLLITLLRN